MYQLISKISSIEIPNASDLVCMAVHDDHQIVAVGIRLPLKLLKIKGSQFAAVIMDHRTSSVVSRIPSNDADWGIRSLGFSHNLLSMGGGMVCSIRIVMVTNLGTTIILRFASQPIPRTQKWGQMVEQWSW